MDVRTLRERIIDDTISLSSALLHVRQMFDDVADDKYSQWLDKEIGGYEYSDALPSYRQIYAPVKFICESPVRKSQICTLEKLEYNDDLEIAKSFKKVNTLYIKQPLASIEATWQNINGLYGECEISDKQRELLEEWYAAQLSQVAGYITRGWHEISKASIACLTNAVKIKLLSILNYLSENYPQLNKESMSKNQSVVITGNNNPINIVNGENNVINSTNIILDEIAQGLRRAGVTDGEIKNLEEIVNSEPSKSKTLKDKLNKWLKGLSVAADIFTVSQLIVPLL